MSSYFRFTGEGGTGVLSSAIYRESRGVTVMSADDLMQNLGRISRRVVTRMRALGWPMLDPLDEIEEAVAGAGAFWDTRSIQHLIGLLDDGVDVEWEAQIALSRALYVPIDALLCPDEQVAMRAMRELPFDEGATPEAVARRMPHHVDVEIRRMTGDGVGERAAWRRLCDALPPWPPGWFDAIPLGYRIKASA